MVVSQKGTRRLWSSGNRSSSRNSQATSTKTDGEVPKLSLDSTSSTGRRESTPSDGSGIKRSVSHSGSTSKMNSTGSPSKLPSILSGGQTSGSTASPQKVTIAARQNANEQTNIPPLAAVAAATGDSAAITAVAKMRGSLNMVPVNLKEAAVDSPSFRAYCEYMDGVVNEIEQWLENFSHLIDELNAEMNNVKVKVNDILGVFPPSFANSGVLSQDYTSLLFGRYAQLTHQMWTDIMSTYRAHEQRIKDAPSKTVFSEYHKKRVQFLTEQKQFDEKFYAYMAMNKNSDPEELRKAVYAVFEARKRYKRASFALSIALNCIGCESTTILINNLSQPFKIKQTGFQYSGVGTLDARVEMHRLSSFARRLRATTAQLPVELEQVADDLISQFKQNEKPSKDLKDYQEFTADPTIGLDTPKMGWVLFKFPRQNEWLPRWLFVSNGVLGWLGLSSNKTFVQDSAKYSAGDCEIESMPQSPRRFVFSVKLPDQQESIEVQATSKADLSEWLSVFKYVRRTSAAIDKDIVLPPLQTDLSLKDEIGANDKGRKTKDNINLNSEIDRRLKESMSFQCRHSAMISSSTLGQSAHGFPVSSIISVKPMPTSHFQEASIAYWYIKPQGFPNSITSNYWGTIDWISRERRNYFNYQQISPHYPSWYPLRMIYQDGDMRAALEQSDAQRAGPENLLLMLLRGSVKVSSTREIPARLYVTSRDIFLYIAWGGFVSIHSISLSRLLETDVKPYVDYDEMFLVCQSEDGTTDTYPMRFYIDSAALAKRRLDFLVNNRRGDSPRDPKYLLEQISAMGDEHAELTCRYDSEEGLNLPSQDSATPPSSSDSNAENSVKPDTEDYNPTIRRMVAKYLRCGIESPLTESNGRDAWAGQEPQTQMWKLAEDVYPCSSTVLFHVIFGDKSQVFHELWPEVEPKIGPWVLRRSHVERLIHENGMPLLSKTGMRSDKDAERVSLQRVISSDSADVYIVNERRAGWELPAGSIFNITYNYRIFSTENGSIIRIYGQIVWQNEIPRSAEFVDLAAHEVAKAHVRRMLVATRKYAAKPPNGTHLNSKVIELFGRVRPTKTVQSLRRDVSYTKVHRSQVLKAFVFRFSIWSFKYTLALLSASVRTLRSLSWPQFWGIIFMIFSVLLNIYLSTRATFSFWAVWYMKNYQQTSADVLLPAEGLISKHEISMKELNEAVSSGTLFQPTNLMANNSCGIRFLDAINITSSYEDAPITLESVSQDMGERIAHLRTQVAFERSKLMAEIRLLNAYETELLKREWTDWVAGELKLCADTRSVLHLLDIDVLSRMREYCLSCEEVSKLL